MVHSAFSQADALLNRLIGDIEEERPIVCVVGLGVSLPVGAGSLGVPGADEIRATVIEILRAAPRPPSEEPETYSGAFRVLEENRGADYGNRVIREAVLKACSVKERALLRQAIDGDAKACIRLEQQLDGWHLSPGLEALGRLIVGYPASFRTILTTNFDPLLEIAIRRAGGEPLVQVVPGDDSLETVGESRQCRIVHLHGHWRRPEMLHAEADLTSERPKLAESLGNLYRGSTVWSIGSGGWDDIITAELARAVANRKAPCRPLWSLFEENPSAAQIEDLKGRFGGEEAWRKFQVYSGIDVHRFAPELWSVAVARRPPAQIEGAETAYRAWAANQHSHLDLIGLETGSGRLPLSKVYVSLQAIAHRRTGPGLSVAGHLASVEEPELEGFAGEERLELDETFRFPDDESPHLAVFGEAGSGKTTALEKLFGLCLKNATGRGLTEGTLPVFMKLSRLSAEVLTGSLEALVAAALEQEGAPGGDLAAWLWQRGRLLLLCDGLDEIRDPELRKKFCEHLAERLAKAAQRGLRAVISCRREGYGEHLEDLGPTFLHLAVQPLGPDKSERLVKQWFAAVKAAKTAPFGRTDLGQAQKELLQQLNDPRFRADRRLAMISSPLLLTLLCLLVARGGEMPRHRASFFAEALRLLLGRWQAARGDRPPIPVDRALALLAPIAWRMHVGGSGAEAGRTDLAREELLYRVGEGLALQRSGADPALLVDWLCQQAAILEPVGEDRLAFRHLRFQEYLSALFVASRRGEAFDLLLDAIEQRWSREVTALLVGLPGYSLFAPVMDRLLPNRRLTDDHFYRQLIEEAAELEVKPLVEALTRARGKRSRILRRLSGVPVFDRSLAELLLRLVLEGSGSVPHLAAQRLLEGTEVRATGAAQSPVLDESGRTRLRALAGRKSLDPQLQDKVRQLAERDGLWGTVGERVHSPGAKAEPRAAAKEFGLKLSAPLGTPRAAEAEAPITAHGGSPVRGEPFTESATSIRFLWVPGERFRMGDQTAGIPEKDVEVAPFWLAETAVTNDQYGRFLADNKDHEEPGAWRDPRFSNTRQPVVAVNWHDAQAFCAWLAKRSGAPVQLPAESQWEFAARSADGRRYPWGEKSPQATHADYGQNFYYGQPAAVGSFPAGAGPFGHLDLAGGVWEWCADDPGDDGRTLRGGSWADSAGSLPSAFRHTNPARYRHRLIGFRVAAVPPSS